MIAHMKTHQLEEAKLKEHLQKNNTEEMSEMWSEFDPSAASNFVADDFDIA